MPTGSKRRLFSNIPSASRKERRVQPPLARRQGDVSARTLSNGRQTESQRSDGSEQPLPARLDFDGLTGLLPEDVNTISMILNAAEKRLTSHVSSVCNKLALEIKANGTTISELSKTVRTLDTNVSNLKVLTLQNSVTIARKKNSNGRGSSKSNKGLKFALQKEIEAKHPNIIVELAAVFHSQVFSRAAGHSVCSYLDSFHGKQDDYRVTARTLSVLLYGLQTNMLLAEFKHGLGRQHANFRFKISLSATREALRQTDDTFTEQEKQIIADLVRDGKINPGEIVASSRKPSWLSTSMLTKELMVHARTYHECLKSEHAPLPKGQRQRLALHVCRHAVKGAIDLLRIAREKCKLQLFAAGLFLLIDWSKKDAFKPGHTQPVIRFVNPTSAPVSPGSIQDCSTVNVENYEIINSTIVKKLLSTRDEMIIEATYAVTVVLQKHRVEVRNKMLLS